MSDVNKEQMTSMINDLDDALVEKEHLRKLFAQLSRDNVSELAQQLNESRKALESFIINLQKTWDFTIPKKAGPDEVIALMRKRIDQLHSISSPRLIFEHLRTIGRYGNVGSHFQENQQDDSYLEQYIESIEICKIAWQGLVKWVISSFPPHGRSLPLTDLEKDLISDLNRYPLKLYNTHKNRPFKKKQKVIQFLLSKLMKLNLVGLFKYSDSRFAYWDLQALTCTHSDPLGHPFYLISWRGLDHYKEKGIRLSCLDFKLSRYRHILLIQPSDDQAYFKTLPSMPHHIHAFGSYLLFSYEKSNSIHLYYLESIFKTDANASKNLLGKGKIVTQNLYAYNYRYVAPMIATFQHERIIINIGGVYGRSADSNVFCMLTTLDQSTFWIEIGEFSQDVTHFKIIEEIKLNTDLDWDQAKGINVVNQFLFIVVENSLYAYDLETALSTQNRLLPHSRGLYYSPVKGTFQTLSTYRRFRGIYSLPADSFDQL